MGGWVRAGGCVGAWVRGCVGWGGGIHPRPRRRRPTRIMMCCAPGAVEPTRAGVPGGTDPRRRRPTRRRTWRPSSPDAPTPPGHDPPSPPPPRGRPAPTVAVGAPPCAPVGVWARSLRWPGRRFACRPPGRVRGRWGHPAETPRVPGRRHATGPGPAAVRRAGPCAGCRRARALQDAAAAGLAMDNSLRPYKF